MKTQDSMGTAAVVRANGRDGVALIICLGLLAIMTLMAVTFAVAMRVERMAARNFADGVRARHIVQAALVRAMQDIDGKMIRKVYPDQDVWASGGSGDAELASPQVESMLPAGELRTAFNSATPKWIDTGIPGGRVAYVIVNTSGLIDINTIGGVTRSISTNFGEISFAPANAPGIRKPSDQNFLSNRTENVRYDTRAELQGLLPSHFDKDVETFETFSYEPGRDKVFMKFPKVTNSQWWKEIDKTRPPPSLGTREAEDYLHDKFNINSFTNPIFPSYKDTGGGRDRYTTAKDPAFIPQYWTPLRDMLRDAVLTDTGSQSDRPDDVAWNIVNYLDEDRIPQGTDARVPWTKSEGGEPIPLVNEIVVEQVGAAGTPTYKVSAELWYPFAPLKVEAADQFGAQLWIWTEEPPGLPVVEESESTRADAVTNSAYINDAYSVTRTIDAMEFGKTGGGGEFFIIETPTITLTNALGSGGAFWLLVRVIKTDAPINSPQNRKLYIVDEAMGYDTTDMADARRRKLFKIDSASKLGSYQINDPRSNGQVRYWDNPPGSSERVNGYKYPAGSHTLRERNTALKLNLNRKGQGLPIYAPDPPGPMRNIGELGHIWRSNLDDAAEARSDRDCWWRTLDLMHKTEGAALLDMMCTGVARPPYRGTFSANSRQKGPWKVMLNDLKIGLTNYTDEISGQPLSFDLRPSDVDSLVDELNKWDRFVSFSDMFNNEAADEMGGPIADAFRDFAPNAGDLDNDIFKEDTFRHICELMSFRQNIFTIVLAAQVMGANGTTPIAERRAVATIYRDAYTGRRFTRSFTWIDN